MSSLSLLSGVPGFPDATSVGAGGELESQLTPWLGPPNQFAPLNLDIEGKNPHITHNLPLAFWGKSKVMEAIIEFRITKKNDWYTSELMPWKKSDQINFSWMVFKYDKSFFEVEPYGGNPNYIQSGMEAYSDKMIQRGMAFTIAHGFWQTEMGRQQYMMNIEVLESSAQLTIYHLIVMSLLRSKNIYRNWELRFKNPVTSIPQALRRFKIKWAILNKGMHLFRQFHADLVEVMESRGVQPNIWAMPPKTKILMSHKHDSEYDYSQAGPLSQKVRREGQTAYDTIRGVKIYETTVFNEVMFGQMYNPLRRIREYGSFFWITNYHGSAHLDKYRNEDRFSAKILDASKDGQETKISGKPLFRLSQRFAADGSLSNTHSEIIRDNIREDLRRRLNDSPNNNYLDMFVGYDPSRDSANPYYVMEYLGEMWEMDVRKDQIRDFAITACNKLDCLTRDEICAIDDADRFMEDLNNVDFDIKEHRQYWQALVLSGVVPGSENQETNSALLKNNGDGCVFPPILSANSIQFKIGGTPTDVVFYTNNGVEYAITESVLTGIANADLATSKLDVLEASTGTALTGNTTGTNILATVARGTEAGTNTPLRLKANSSIGKTGRINLPPLGFGHPTGLRTLANLQRRNDLRGYEEKYFTQATLHYNTICKFHSVWKNVFPDHELGKSSAVPYYFKTGYAKADEVTAFALNLYSHAKYPVFGVVGTVGNGYTFDNTGARLDVNIDRQFTDAVQANVADTFGAKVFAGMAKIGATTTDAQTTTVLEYFVQNTDSAEVRAALLERGLWQTLTLNYRNKPFVKDGKNLALDEFLATIVSSNTTNDKKTKILTTVLEILLRNGYNDPVNWVAEMNLAAERPVRVQNVMPKQPAFNKPVADSTGTEGRRYLNTRLTINASVFRRLAEKAERATDAEAAAIYANIPVRPMNIFNPSVPLGLYKQDGKAPSNDAEKKAALADLKFSAAPQGGNTVHSLTTSPLFASHLDQLTSFSGAQNKRVIDEYSGNASVKKRMVGGVLMTQNLEMADSSVQTARLFGGVPVSYTAYQATPGTPYTQFQDPDPSGTIPANIALSEAYRIFTHDGVHGGVPTRHYRQTLVARFHEWASETNVCHRVWAQSWITSKIKRQTFEAFWDQDVIPLVSFELHRIRQRYYMGSGFLAEGGDRLGNAYHGFHDFQWTDDIIRKVHVGHYTFLFAAPVKDPKMFALCEDIVAMGHIPGGEDVSFIGGPDDFNMLCTDPDNAPGCILVKMVPYNRELPTSPQDVSGRWNQTVLAQCSVDGMSDQNQIHGQSVYFYGHLYKLLNINQNMVQREPIFHSPTTTVNTVVWLGHHRLFDPVSQTWTEIILDDGPFGHDVYKGVISDRDITGRAIKNMHFEETCKIFS